MTWEERHLMEAGTKVHAAYKLLDEAVHDLDAEKFPMACGLIKGATVSTLEADKELGKCIHDATERINQ